MARVVFLAHTAPPLIIYTAIMFAAILVTRCDQFFIADFLCNYLACFNLNSIRNAPLTYCVGIDKEKELQKALAQKLYFSFCFYSFVCQTFFRVIQENALIKLCFCRILR